MTFRGVHSPLSPLIPPSSPKKIDYDTKDFYQTVEYEAEP